MKTNNIRKAILTAAAILAAAAADAQTIYDILRISERNYEGTARSVAMGNAFTALGGDLGSIVFNPAGSAVAGYSQIALTPSLTISSNATEGYRNTSAQVQMPNIGFTFNWDTGRSYGLKNFTFGFVVNQTNSWNEDIYASGRNNSTSFMGSLAAGTTALMANLNNNLKPGENPYTYADLAGDQAYDYMPWKEIIGYQSGMISTYGGHDDEFVGASEVLIDHDGVTEIALGGPLDQTYGRRTRGSRSDYLLNFGVNISNFIYIGANLGISSMTYSYSEYYKEDAVDPKDFELSLDSGESMYFSNMKYTSSLNCETTGIYGKIGVIVTPGYGLRIGAAIQTPTASTVRETWEMSGETRFTDQKYNASALSPYGDDTYSLKEPWRANFGIAYTLGKFAAISADYEFCDYSHRAFRTSHMLRTGLEIKPFDMLAIRAGYNLTTSPDREFHAPELDTEEASKGLGWIAGRSTAPLQNVSFGLGYISRNSFYADIACRYILPQNEYFMPYDNYIFDSNGNVASDAAAPVIVNKADAWKVLLTLGWRF